jgi:alpha-tubulin suppressor-like RCC1 family protein
MSKAHSSLNIRAPCLVEALKHTFITKVDCGGNFTMALSQAKRSKHFVKKAVLYSWGDNQYCQLGVATNSDLNLAGHR